MSERKKHLRAIVLDIVFGRAQPKYPANQIGHLLLGVAEIDAGGKPIAQQQGLIFSARAEARLEPDDENLVHEIVWDLIVQRVLTVGLNSSNPNLPFFRLHSEASDNLLDL